MVKLQRPAFVFMNGKLVPWDDANLHVSSPAAIRGISVLEGIKGYWQHDESHLALLALRPTMNGCDAQRCSSTCRSRWATRSSPMPA